VAVLVAEDLLRMLMLMAGDKSADEMVWFDETEEAERKLQALL